MARKTRWKLAGEALKKAMLEGLIDKENKCKISDREFMRTKSSELTIDGKPIGCGIWTFWTKHKDIINSNPMKGMKVCEETAYLWAIQNNIFTKEEVPYDDFTKDTQKKRNKLDEETLMRYNEISILGFAQSNALPLATRKQALLIISGEEEYEKINKKNKKKLLRR